MEDAPKLEEFDFQKSPLKEAYVILGATTPLELRSRYVDEEQPAFKDGTWDYDNPGQIQNIIKEILESVPSDQLEGKEKYWRDLTLWFWYHHAITVAGWKKDKEKMKYFSEKAMEVEDTSNILTRTMYLLVHDKIEKAEEWVNSKKGNDDEETAREMLENYKKIGWLWPDK